ncbi:unnamed protein product [Trichobilharzia regenti]|nr:unnamed protein product [Trichobilharzia regenti]
MQRKWVKISSRVEDEGIEPKFDGTLKLVKYSVNQAMSKFASILHLTPRTEKSEGKTQSFITKGSQRSGCRESLMVSSNPYKLSDSKSLRETSPTDRIQVARQTRLCFARLREVHTKANCESVTKFSGKLNVKSESFRSESNLCDDNGAMNKPVFATGKPFVSKVS